SCPCSGQAARAAMYASEQKRCTGSILRKSRRNPPTRPAHSSRHSSRQKPDLLLDCLLVAMPKKTGTEPHIELLQGTLDMLILRTLQWGPQHGHGVGQAIRQTSVDLLQIERGSLYPALHRLEERGLIASEWKAS